MKSYILTISAGQGPEECQRATYLVGKMLQDYLNQNQIKQEIINSHTGVVKNANHSIDILLQLKDVEILQEWIGTILWISASPFRPAHKRKNWYIQTTLAEMATLPQFNEHDVVFQTCRSSGPGGQNVNKVETAVRATHIPSGFHVVSNTARTQLENKKLCMIKMQMHFETLKENRTSELKKDQWSQHHLLERGNPIKTIKKQL